MKHTRKERIKLRFEGQKKPYLRKETEQTILLRMVKRLSNCILRQIINIKNESLLDLSSFKIILGVFCITDRVARQHARSHYF